MRLTAPVRRWARATPRRAHLALPLMMMAALYWLSSIPGVLRPDDPAHYALFHWVSPAVQNLLHVPVFAALAASLHWALGAWCSSQVWRASLGCAIASAYGVFDEWHQSFVPGRYASLTDVALDVAGAVLGACLMAAITEWARTIRSEDVS